MLSYDFWLNLGNFCKDVVVPILAVLILSRIYFFIGYKSKAYARGLQFFDTFITKLAEEFRNANAADIINFKNNNKQN